MGQVATVVRVTLAAGLAAAVVAGAQPAVAAGPAPVTGVVQDVVVDDPARQPRAGADDDETRRVLRAGDEVIALTDDSLPAADNGDTVRVRLAPAAGGEQRVTSAVTVAEAPAGSAAGAAAGSVAAAATPQQVYAVIVTPKGVAADSKLTAAAVKTAVASASSYWSSQTAGAISFNLANAAAVPAYTSATACTAADAENRMWTEALTKVTVPANANNHLMIFAPAGAASAGCAYGLGSIGAWSGKPGLTFVSATNQSLVAHELGHNLGLYHSGALRCGTLQDGAYLGPENFKGCELEDYGDLFDVMGYSGTGYGEGSLNAVQMEQLGLGPIGKVTTGGAHTVRIAPLTAAATATRALRVVEPSGATYHVEYRVATGRDAVAPKLPFKPTAGVRVLRALSPDGGSGVLDATPTGSDSDYTHHLAVGQTFTSASRSLTITVTAADSGGATLEVRNGEASVPARARLTGLPARAKVGNRVTATVTVTNAAGRPVPGWSVSLQKYARGTKAYVTMRTVRTNARGVASFPFANGHSGTYRYVTAAASGAPARVSNAVAVTSVAVVSARRPASSIRRGKKVTVTGTVSAVPSRVVYVQVRRGNGRWTTPVRATVRGNKVTGKVKLAKRGTYQVRFYLKADRSGRYLAATSTAYKVRAR